MPIFIRLCRTKFSFVIALLFVLQQFSFAASINAAPIAIIQTKNLISDGLVISQVYGGGGNAGAPFTHDFVELFNRGSVSVNINGWSIQYGSATGTGNLGANATQITELPNVTIQPGQYYLVQQASGTNGVPIPTPDYIDPTPINMAGGAGKVALANISVSLGCNGGSNPCNPTQLGQIVDLVGYGNANFFEGAGAVAALSNTTAGLRGSGGCIDTDNNNTDFSVAAPAPRNSSTTQNSCTPTTTNPSGIGAANPSAVLAGDSTLLTVTVTPGTNPVSTGLAVEADLTSIGGSSNQMLFDDGTNGDKNAGDNIFSFEATVSAKTSVGDKVIPAEITDEQSRTNTTNISLTVVSPGEPGQSLPFFQNWSAVNQITVENDWSGVPGITGYRGDGMAGAAGVDPQTVLQDGSNTPVQVYANSTNPNIMTSGGVAEFELMDAVVALQGSGTARAPHIVISVNTIGAENITVSYNLRDVDGSADNSVQPVALHYRIGDVGNFTNVPSAFVADASSGPNEATKVTPVGVLLPSNAEGHELVQLRIMTTDAVGSDEWIGIDDILIESNGTLPLSASGSANPTLVNAGSAALLTVAVNPATNPLSTGIQVEGDLTTIGGAINQQFFDDGTNGDLVAGDNIFSYSALVPAETSGGTRSLSISVTDAQSRNTSTSIALTVRAAPDPLLHITMGNPSNAVSDVGNPENYLMLKDQYVLSYNRDKGTANWVAWHLDSSWLGSAPRQDDFRADTTLPKGWYRVTEVDYQGSGFDRGHHAPSGDRTATVPDNSETFLMTNMMPQAPDNNQGPWEQLESHSRSLVNQGNELYIYMGGAGIGGTGSNGGITTTITNGNVTVPAYTWKVIMVLPSGEDDVARVNENTRAIAVIMPNRQGIRTDPWQKYLASVDQVEALTGYDFFSNVSTEIQDVIESRLDAASNTAPQTIATGTFENLAIDAPNTTLTGDITVNGVLTLGGSTLRTGTSNRIILGPNASVQRISGLVDGSVQKQFNTTGAFQYPVGTTNGYTPVTVNVTNLGAPSSLTISAVQGTHPNAPLPQTALGRYWQIAESGDITADLTFNYLERDIPQYVNEDTFSLHRYDGTFSLIPSVLNTELNTVFTSGISSFSDWTLFGELEPTTAPVSVSGRILSATGTPVYGATVNIIDSEGNKRTAVSNPFGYYTLEGIMNGSSYIVSVNHRRYVFNSQTIELSESITGLDFQAVQ